MPLVDFLILTFVLPCLCVIVSTMFKNDHSDSRPHSMPEDLIGSINSNACGIAPYDSSRKGLLNDAAEN